MGLSAGSLHSLDLSCAPIVGRSLEKRVRREELAVARVCHQKTLVVPSYLAPKHVPQGFKMTVCAGDF
jgi:hypothetical protein